MGAVLGEAFWKKKKAREGYKGAGTSLRLSRVRAFQPGVLTMKRAIGGLLAAAFIAGSAQQGTLRIGMTASDIPLTTGQTDQGGEGMRFMGYTVYDALINWDLSSATKPSGLTPGLATSWGVDEADATEDQVDLQAARGREIPRRLGVHRRERGVESRQDHRRRIPAVRCAPVGAGPHRAFRRSPPTRRSTSYTVEITTKAPDATLPYQIAWIMMSSPAQCEKVGKSWEAFARTPSGTGPWKLDKFVPRERAELVAQQGVLGQGARAQARPARAAAAARGELARCRAALRSGRLDRGAAAGCDPVAEAGEVRDRHQCLSA